MTDTICVCGHPASAHFKGRICIVCGEEDDNKPPRDWQMCDNFTPAYPWPNAAGCWWSRNKLLEVYAEPGHCQGGKVTEWCVAYNGEMFYQDDWEKDDLFTRCTNNPFEKYKK
jgi:hypothetical protein